MRGGLPHSEIPGSPIARISPGLFAACHVLHRLSVPRHPPDALDSRLSATPNGKNHRQTPHARVRLVERCPGQSRGPPWAGIPLSSAEHLLSAHRRCASCSGGTMCRRVPPLEDTIGIPHTDPLGQTARQAGDGWIPPRSQLAYSHLSINKPPGGRGPAEGNICFMPRIDASPRDAPARLSAKAMLSPVALGRTAFVRWWR